MDDNFNSNLMISESMFRDLEAKKISEAEICNIFYPFLNQMSCLRDIQEIRQKWVNNPKEQKAFGNFNIIDKHWYMYNYGGRSEAQFNLGLKPNYFRVGLGFEFTDKTGRGTRNGMGVNPKKKCGQLIIVLSAL